VNTFHGRLVNAGATVATLRSPATLTISEDYEQPRGVLRLCVFGATVAGSTAWKSPGRCGWAGLEIRLCDAFIRLSTMARGPFRTRVEGVFEKRRRIAPLAGSGSCEVVYGKDGCADALPGRSPERTPRTKRGEIAALAATHDRPFPAACGVTPRRIRSDLPRSLDDSTLGLGGQMVEFDFVDRRVVDGPDVTSSCTRPIGAAWSFNGSTLVSATARISST